MTESSITRELALRIGLAARTLPEMDVATLLGALDTCIGLPLDKKRLATLTAAALKRSAGDALEEVEATVIEQAVSILKGETSLDFSELPEVEALAGDELPGSLRVAVASNGGEQIDGHFGSCRRFLIYQVNEQQIRLAAIRSIDAAVETAVDDKNAYRADLIGDCQLLYVASIGGPAAAKVVRRMVHPIKQLQGGSARETLAALQKVMAQSPPPWLAKVMGQAPEDRIRFERDPDQSSLVQA